MQIDLHDDEVPVMLDLLLMAQWMLESGYEKLPREREPHAELLDRLVRLFARHPATALLVEIDEETGQPTPTDDYYEDGLWRDIADDYDNFVFWEEIIDRFGERDSMLDYSDQEWKRMSQDERFTAYMRSRETYEREFTENGIDRLRIVRGSKPKR